MADTGSDSQYMCDAGLSDVSAVVATLPSAYNLGMVRTVNGTKYKLCYNAGGSDIPAGMFATPIAGGGPNSVTVSTAAFTFNEYGGVCRNHAATASTGVYFWGAVKGPLSSGVIASAACVPSGTAFYLGTNGNVIAVPQSVVTGLNPIGMALTTVLSTTSGSGRNGSVLIHMPGTI